jgi:drug/metabolite transporter (DMT)-like permease
MLQVSGIFSDFSTFADLFFEDQKFMAKKILHRFGIYPIVILSMIFWGMSFVWTSIVFKYYHPITTIFLRLVISSILLTVFIFITGKFEKLKKEDRGLLLISALFNPFLYFLGENFGLMNSSPTISSVIIATIPVEYLRYSHFLPRHRDHARQP